MVKPDAKHDYYADLDLPQTADAEEIKKQFRLLAKQYHPDRNPGREVDVVAKFQAVQAAHEILSDAATKTKYDNDRAKLNRSNNFFGPGDPDPYNFRRPAPKTTTNAPAFSPPNPSAYPAPPRRTQTTKDFGASGNPRFAAPNGTANREGPTSGADQFRAFRAAPQQWDRSKFEEAARADAARGFQNMAGAKPFPGTQMGPPPPQPPPQPARPPRAPTAPKPNPYDPTTPNVPTSGPAPGFPGMSRTANARRPGFDPTSPGMDEPQAPNRPSAYASYNRGERPQASNPQAYFAETGPPRSPPMTAKKPTASPLRHVRSETGWDVPKPQRPEFERVSSKYANTPGERTNVGGNLGRSSSVRTSPVEKHWEEHEGRPQGRPHSHHGPPRHHSSSPKIRPTNVKVEFSSSSSESSADERPNLATRPKVQHRRPRVQTASSDQQGYRPFSADDPALTGHFSSKNYTKIVDDSQYNYPPPTDGPVRRPFSNMPSPETARATMNGTPVPKDEGLPKYDPPSSFFQSSSGSARAPRRRMFGSTRNSTSAWHVPSSVMPGLISPLKQSRMFSIPEERSNRLKDWLSDHPVVSDFETSRVPWKADGVSLSSQRHPPPEHVHSSQNAPNTHSVSENNVKSRFTAADWEGKFGSGEEFFRPNSDTSDRERRSPTGANRTKARPTGKVRPDGQHSVPEDATTMPDVNGHVGTEAAGGAHRALSGQDGNNQSSEAQEQPKGAAFAAFQPGKFSADEWAEKFKEQNWATTNNDPGNTRPRPQKKPSKSGSRNAPSTEAFPPPPPPTAADLGGDAMDIDEDLGGDIPSKFEATEQRQHVTSPHNEGNGGLNVNLEDLKHTAPFAPSATGLDDLHDLSSDLPFKSRPAASVEPVLNRTISSTARRLDLPKPPRPVIPPDEHHLSQEVWEKYVHNINIYLHDWNVFNIKMLDHFRTRQDQINVGMRNNWISSVGDGPSVEAFDAAGDGNGVRAGFATYMAWLEDDSRCRSWWDAANEEHRECFENVARIRAKVKKAAGVV